MKPIILITGTSTGIGAALAKAAMKDYRVLGSSRNPRSDPSLGFKEYLLDLANLEDIEAFADELVKDLKGAKLHAIVHNAGVMIPGTVLYTPVETFAYQLQVNLLGLYQLTQLLIPVMEDGDGRILNIGSISASFSNPFQGMYSASKSSLACMTKSWRIELEPKGIQVSQLDFGNVRTGIHKRAIRQFDELLQGASDFSHLIPNIRKLILNKERKAMSADKAAQYVLGILKKSRLKAFYLLGTDAQRLKLIRRLPKPWLEALIKRKIGLR
ncbi:MAG: SDR family NAD(P)-dependent oxidoreductase [Bacteroidota bacterium]